MGPTDDGMIVTALAGLPQDAYCCAGPQLVDGGALEYRAVYATWCAGDQMLR